MSEGPGLAGPAHTPAPAALTPRAVGSAGTPRGPGKSRTFPGPSAGRRLREGGAGHGKRAPPGTAAAGGGAGPAVAPGGSTCPGGPAGGARDPAGERCPARAAAASATPLGPGDAEDAPAGAAADDEGDLRRGSLAEAVSAGLRYPEPCLLLFPSPVSAFLCFQMKLAGSLLGRALPALLVSCLLLLLCCLSLQLCINECLCTGNLSASGEDALAFGAGLPLHLQGTSVRLKVLLF